MGGFSGDLAAMQKASQDVLNVSHSIQGELNALMGKLQDLEGKWAGSAKATFDNLKQTWHDNARNLSIALQGISGSLGATNHIYHSHDDDAVQDLNRVLHDVPYTKPNLD